MRAGRSRLEHAAIRAFHSGSRTAQGRTPPGDGGSTNVFRREGDTWTLAFGGRSVPLRDAKGLRDLAVLVAAPGRDVAATELIAGVTTAAGPGWPGSMRNWRRPTRTMTSSGRPGWPPNVMR